MNANDHEQLQRLIREIDPGSRLLRAWDLHGGVSAQVTALEIEGDGGLPHRLVVRQHGDVDLRANPNIATDEFRLLAALHAAGLPVARPRFVDQSGALLGRPCVVVEYIDGEAEFTPAEPVRFVHELATQLARIHGLDPASLGLDFLPRQEDRVAATMREWATEASGSALEGLVREKLAEAWPLPRANLPVLLHGDFWPGNLLWRDGELVGIIDWEDAATGDPLADLANTRVELLWALGDDAMEHFTDAYRSLMPGISLRNLPYWDLYVAARVTAKLSGWGLADAEEQAMRAKLNEFITRAHAALGM